MKKRYVSTVVLVILIVFFLAFIGVNYTKHYYLTRDLTGMVSIPVSDCPCTDGSAPGQCSVSVPGKMCIEVEPGACSLLYACEVCGGCSGLTPYCVPGGASGLGVCSSVAPRVCGDGVCSSSETCSSCPQDCQDKRANCGENFICDGGECVIGSSCGNSICELSLGETCSNCYQDCQGLKANCDSGEVCLYSDRDGSKAECVVSCGKNIPCGCFERECPRDGPAYAFEGIIFNYTDVTGHHPEEYRFDVNWKCFGLNDPIPDDPHLTSWLECIYASPNRVFMEVIESDTPGYCNDGTPEKQCSLTRPLYCKNDRLVNLCSECGCSPGYYCDAEREVCLTNQSYIQINETGPQLSPGTGEEDNPSLWNQLQKTYGITQGGSAVSATILRKFAEEEGKGIMKSPGRLVTEVVKTKDVDKILKLSPETVEKADNKVKQISNIFDKGSSEDVEDLLFSGDQAENIGFVGDVILQAAKFVNQTNQTPPDMAPPIITEIDPIEIPCVNVSGDNCVGNGVECCEGLVCTSGLCVANTNVNSSYNYSFNNETMHDILNEDEEGLTELVGVNIEGEGGISVSEYETHPAEVEQLEIPNSVTFGFYDIKAENDIGATLSFEVLNDLLVVNQIASIGLYRLTDDGWQSLPLEDVVFSAERTRFTFRTAGFSYFTLKGVKEGINFQTATEQDPSLWSVYRRSFTPGFSLIEFFIGKQDTIIFGIFNNAPLIDLGLSGFN